MTDPGGNRYHPDPEINAGVTADAIEAEQADLAAGYPPRRWRCPCGAEHSRGHFGSVGVHRCLSCGYAGTGGVMLDDGEGRCYCTRQPQCQAGEHDASCLPPAEPGNPELRLLRAIFGLCPLCDETSPHEHTDAEYEAASMLPAREED